MEKITASAAVAKVQADIAVVPGVLKPDVSHQYYNLVLSTYTDINMAGHPAPDTENVHGAVLPLTPAATFPALSAALNKRMDCLMQAIDTRYPLLLDEYAQKETVTTLAEDWLGFSAGTLVFERESNLATMYYIIKNVGLDAGGKLNIWQQGAEEAVTDEKPRIILRGGDKKKKSLGMTIAKGIGGAVLSKIGGFIGDAIMQQLFPAGVPDYFDEVYQEITRIVDQKIDANTILTINGALHNIMEKLDTEYTPAKQASDVNIKADRERLFTLLQKYDTVFLTGPGGMLGSLQDTKLSHAGFTVLTLGVALQMALAQEMAMIDPNNYDAKNNKWKPPGESSYGKPVTGTVSKIAQKFVLFAEKTWPDIIEKRKGKITTEKYAKQVAKGSHPRIGTIFETKYMARIVDMGVPTGVDREIGQDDKHGNNPAYDAFRKDALPGYIQKKINDLTEDMDRPADIIADWRKLINKPIAI